MASMPNDLISLLMPGLLLPRVIQDRPGSNSSHGAASQQGDRDFHGYGPVPAPDCLRRAGSIACLHHGQVNWDPAEFVTNKHPNPVQLLDHGSKLTSV
jgi:hypothetical protein